ncbi:hypothetical protein [Saccharopolyspora pogona]|uniref:hypothetical protein n=1 Tax=Saccharopolyspora pogona TaxID=333966 RepID=UPI00295C26C8|nr:hypothetical protein [Saccharopolyspora pogona]
MGDADPKVTLEEAEAWREHTEAEADVRVFSGGHFFNDRTPGRGARGHYGRIASVILARSLDQTAMPLGVGVHIVTAVRDWV